MAQEEQKYPEHEKVDTEQLRTIAEFIEFLDSKGYSISSAEGDVPVTVDKLNKLKIEFFGTTEEKMEEERKIMLEEQRKLINGE